MGWILPEWLRGQQAAPPAQKTHGFAWANPVPATLPHVNANISKNKLPYRPPCSGLWTGQYTFASAHFRKSENGFQNYQNVTKATFGCPTHSQPVAAVPDCNVSNTCGDGSPQRCGAVPPDPCTPQPGLVMIGDNCFVPVPGKKINRAVCNKTGFKVVQAKKKWQGVDPFIAENCPDAAYELPSTNFCSWYGPRPAPNAARYLTINFSAVATQASTSATIECSGSASVDTTSGIVTLSGYRFDSQWTITVGAGPGASDLYGIDPFNYPYLTASSYNSALGQWTVSYHAPGDAIHTGIANYITPPQCPVYIADGSLTTVVSNTTVNITGTIPVPGFGTFDLVVSIQLESPYTASALARDCDDLLDEWDLADDAQYPWRTDGLNTSAPVVTRNETTDSPWNAVGVAPAWPAVGATTFTDAIPAVPAWTDPNAATFDGSILGAPTPPGYDPYWDYRHQNYQFDPFSGAWNVVSHGAFAPAWCPQATQWIEGFIAQGNYPGAYTLTAEGGVIKQKYAEIYLFAKPSHNFARPCGVADQAQFPGSPNPCPDPPAAHGQWNDTGLKGDFVLRNFIWNYRDVGEWNRLNLQYQSWFGLGSCHDLFASDPPPGFIEPSPPSGGLPRNGNELQNVLLTQSCVSFSPCCPAAIYITPNDETSFNSRTFPLPDVPVDITYGSFAQADIQQWMADPLFLAPSNPADGRTLFFVDDGSCGGSAAELNQAANLETAGRTAIFYSVPYEEARSAPPSGAPALPAGYLMGATFDGSLWQGPMATPPPSGQGFCPWVYWETQLAFNCNVDDYTEFHF